MATLEELVIQLSADTKSLQADMKAANLVMEKSTNEMRKSIEGMGKDGAKSTSMLQTAFATMTGFIGGQAVLGALGAAKDAITGLVNDGIEGAIEAQNAFVAFSSALVSTGRYSKEAAEGFRDFADAQQNLTGISAEAYLSTGKLLTSLTSLAGPELEGATKAIADLSARMGIDMDAAAKMFSRGVETSTTVFKKFGLEIEDGANKSERAANIIEALNSKFGGAAAANANTYAGSLNILKKSFGEVTEEVGNGLVQNPVLIQTMKALSKVFLDLSQFVGENKKEFMDLIGEGIIFAIEAFGTLVGVVNDVWKVFKVLGQAIAEPFQVMATGIEAAKAAAQGDFTAAKNILINGAVEIDKAWKDTLGDSPVLMKIQEKITDVSAAARVGFADMAAGTDVAVTALGNIDNAANKNKASLTTYQEEMKAFAIALAESANTQAELYAMDSEILKTQFDAKLLTEQEYLAAKEAMQIAAYENEKAMLDDAIAQGLIKGEAVNQAKLAMMNKQAILENQLLAQRKTFEQKQLDERLAAGSQFFGNLATLTKTGNKELGAIGKAAAIAQATIDTYAGATKALAQGGMFAGPIAASIVAAGLVNVAKIASTPLATGIDSIPGIGSNDNFPAMLAPNERVVPSKTNEDLTAFLASQSNQPRSSININISMHDIFSSDPREMGMKIIDTINEAAQAHGVTILGSTIS